MMNTYHKAARQFIGKRIEIESHEGTTQRDLIANAYYDIGMNPLMDKFDGEKIVPEWFADDAACPSELLPVNKLCDQLNEFGPKNGYFPKASNVG